jgi:hypothetical protein
MSSGGVFVRLVDGSPPHRDVARLDLECVPAVGDLVVIDGWVWDVTGRMWFPQTGRPAVVLKVLSVGAQP